MRITMKLSTFALLGAILLPHSHSVPLVGTDPEKKIVSSALDGMHSVMLDSDNKAHFAWRTNRTTIWLTLTVRTNGWGAVGFSTGGSMKGADLLIARVANGVVKVEDAYADRNGFPTMDERPSDYRVTSTSFNGTHIQLSASRLLNTCDRQDHRITADTTRVLWALGDVGGAEFSSMTKHGTLDRGSRSVMLLNPQNVAGVAKMRQSADVSHIDITMSNASVPTAHHTMYWCQLIKVPAHATSTHLTGFEPVISPAGNGRFVHHLILYNCGEKVAKETGRSGPCYKHPSYAEADNSQSMESVTRQCMRHVLAAWAYGGEGYAFPPDTALPLFDAGIDAYLLLEMHYDNQDYISGVVDNSGLRLYQTTQPRELSAVHVALGVPPEPDHTVIPPGEKAFTIYSHCPAECTDQLNDGGVTVFAGLLHTHLIGTRVRIRHIRNGVELPYVQADDNYDFNYQNMVPYATRSTILPGDDLVLECEYDSSALVNTTIGGESTINEMCIAFMYGVRNGARAAVNGSANSMISCFSLPSVEEFAKRVDGLLAFGGKSKFRTVTFADEKAEGGNRTLNVDDYYNTQMDWDAKSYGVPLRKHLQTVMRDANQIALCGMTERGRGLGSARRYVTVYGQPQVTTKRADDDRCRV